MSARESDDRSVLHRDKREIPRRSQGTLERVFRPGNSRELTRREKPALPLLRPAAMPGGKPRAATGF
ncbi:MAG TPA: hypothetical protein VKE73_06810, partial [Myxococcota bacterium]|nr:hypothetical protein [Myxococcota bacterium]